MLWYDCYDARLTLGSPDEHWNAARAAVGSLSTPNSLSTAFRALRVTGLTIERRGLLRQQRLLKGLPFGVGSGLSEIRERVDLLSLRRRHRSSYRSPASRASCCGEIRGVGRNQRSKCIFDSPLPFDVICART